jgi:hypothetical protein
MISFKEFLSEKYEALAGGSHGHYGHLPDNALRGSHATGAAMSLFKHMQDRGQKKPSIVPQKKTDGSVSVVTVRNHPDSPFHNPKHPHDAVGVAYKGRMESKTIPHNERVAYSKEDVAKHYGKGHHLTPVLSKLVDHAHKIHGDADIIQHDIHTTDPKNDIKHENGKATWQPNTIRNSTTDPREIKKLKKAKIVLASHTKFDKSFNKPSGLVDGKDVKHHDDVYNVNLAAPKIHHSEMAHHNKVLHDHIKDPETRTHLDVVGHGSYGALADRFVNHKVNKGEYGGEEHKPLKHEDFKKFVSDAHDKEIDKAKSEKGKDSKRAEKERMLQEVESHKHSINKAFEVHHAMTAAVNHYVKKTHEADSHNPIKHELPDGKGGFTPAKPEGYVPRGPHEKVNSQKLNPRGGAGGFNAANAAWNAKGGGRDQARAAKDLKEEKEVHHTTTVLRANPPHNMHAEVVRAVANHAKQTGGSASAIVTNTQDNKKNPLTGAEKTSFLKKIVPEHKNIIHQASPDRPSLFHHLAHLHKSGVTHATVVLGKDEMGPLGEPLKANNGKFDDKGNGYHFKSLKVISRNEVKGHEKTPEGAHASDIRSSIMKGDDSVYKSNLPGHIKDHEIKKIGDTIRERLQPKPRKSRKKVTEMIKPNFKQFLEGWGASTQAYDRDRSANEWNAVKEKHKDNPTMTKHLDDLHKANWKASYAEVEAKKRASK